MNVDIVESHGTLNFVIDGVEVPTKIYWSVDSGLKQNPPIHNGDLNAQMQVMIKHELKACADCLCMERNYSEEVRQQLMDKIDSFNMAIL